MKIIPVIDLLNGAVVHGIAGQRDRYQPVQSKLTDDSTPRAVALAFAKLNLSECYLADLDGIAGNPPNWQTYQEVAELGFDLWIDAGLNSIENAERMLEFTRNCPRKVSVIIGLETLTNVALLDELVALVGPDQIVFSLDLNGGEPMTTIDSWKNASPISMVGEIIAKGISRLIVLDLAQVGTSGGCSTLDLSKQLSQTFSQLEITTGGGVRNVGDLQQLAENGVQAVLLATALHEKRITEEEISQIANYTPTL